MKRWLSVLILIGAILGLLGQSVTFAHVMPVQKAEEVAGAQMSPECAKMMGLAKQKPQPEKPCQNMTPDCMAKAGCAVPMALLPPITFDAFTKFRAAAPQQVPVAALIGRVTGPELHPPARLG